MGYIDNDPRLDMAGDDQPVLGDHVLYRETCVRPGLLVDEHVVPAVVTRLVPDGDGGATPYIDTYDATMHGMVGRWRPAKAAPGSGSYGWCWPSEASLPPTKP